MYVYTTPTAPNTVTETVFGVFFLGLNTSEGLHWNCTPAMSWICSLCTITLSWLNYNDLTTTETHRL